MDLRGWPVSSWVACALVLLGGCADEPVVLPAEHATIVLTPPPLTKGPPATTATLPPVLAPDTISRPTALPLPRAIPGARVRLRSRS